jgi:hypothetical protein
MDQKGWHCSSHTRGGFSGGSEVSGNNLLEVSIAFLLDQTPSRVEAYLKAAPAASIMNFDLKSSQ